MTTVSREAECVKCRQVYGYEVVILGAGREVPSSPPGCPECVLAAEEEARAREETEKAARARAEVEAREAGILNALKQTGVNPWSHGCCELGSFQGLDNPDALDAAHEFVDAVRGASEFEYTPGLFLAGPTGVGKSHLAVAIVRALLLDGWAPDTILFERAGRLISVVQESYSHGGTPALMDDREEAALWVVDDLGAEKPTPDVARILTEVLSAREGRPTVITSNLTPPDLLGRYPDFGRVVSRLGPACFRTVELQGRDQRYRKAG